MLSRLCILLCGFFMRAVICNCGVLGDLEVVGYCVALRRWAGRCVSQCVHQRWFRGLSGSVR